MSRNNNIVLRWNNALLHSVRATSAKPPVVARAIAMTHVAMYDAWAHYDAKAKAIHSPKLRRAELAQRTDANRQAAASYAAFRVLSELFSDQKPVFEGLMREYSYDINAKAQYDKTTPAKDADLTPALIGNTAAENLLVFHRDDNSNQKNKYEDPTKDYKPVNDPKPAKVKDINRWQPLSPKDKDGVGQPQQFLYPHWGWVTPFVLKVNRDLKEVTLPVKYPRPLPISPDIDVDKLIDAEKQAAQAFEANCHAILKTSENLNDQTKSIAEYWVDGPGSETPPGHWCLLAQHVSLRDTHELVEDIKMFCALGLALHDAAIACWRLKVEQDYCRPVSAIHTLLEGKEMDYWGGPYQGKVKEKLAENWQSYIPTPAFAEFPSGHSTFSSASATILRAFTGSDYFGHKATVGAGSSKIEPGVTPAQNISLEWPYFSDAARQAGISRIYGGIHFENANMEGQKLGKKLGQIVWDKMQQYFNGSLKSGDEGFK